jgi:small subunit ribosomal protein S16
LAVRLRLARFGRLNHPTYRICAAETCFPRDGRVIETLGYYLPKAARVAEQSSLNAERISYWLSVGAQPSETVRSLIKRAGIALPHRPTKPKSERKKKPARKQAATAAFVPPRRLGNGRKAKAKWRQKHGNKAS